MNIQIEDGYLVGYIDVMKGNEIVKKITKYKVDTKTGLFIKVD